MSPKPVLRTQMLVLRNLLGYWLNMIPALVGGTVLTGLSWLVVLMYISGTHMHIGHNLALSLVADLFVLFFFGLYLPCMAQSLNWRSADLNLLGEKAALLPIGGMFKGAAFTFASLMGAATAMLAALYAVPPLLGAGSTTVSPAAKGQMLPHLAIHATSPGVYLIVAAAVVLLEWPLLVRLWLLTPAFALVDLPGVGAWKLILRTTRGKTVPLTAAMGVTVLCAAPPLVIYELILHGVLAQLWTALRSGDAHTWAFMLNFSKIGVSASHTQQILFWLLGFAVLFLSSLAASALTAGVVRHFCGFTSQGFQAERYTPQQTVLHAPTAEQQAAWHFDPNALTDDRPAPLSSVPRPVYDPTAVQIPAPSDLASPLPPVPQQPTAWVYDPAAVTNELPDTPQHQERPVYVPPPAVGADEDPFAALTGNGNREDEDPLAGLR